MEKHSTNLLFVLAFLFAVCGSFLRSGTAQAVQESITVHECKISCKKGSPKFLNGEWTCVDVVRHKQVIVSTAEMISTTIKPPSYSKNGCDSILARCSGMYCQDLRDCGSCCGGTQAPFCFRHKCGCW